MTNITTEDAFKLLKSEAWDLPMFTSWITDIKNNSYDFGYNEGNNDGWREGYSDAKNDSGE